MGVVEDLADALAVDTIKAAEDLGDDLLIEQISKSLGDSSTITQEAFMTSIRVRLAEKRARKLLMTKIATAKKARQDGAANG